MSDRARRPTEKAGSRMFGSAPPAGPGASSAPGPGAPGPGAAAPVAVPRSADRSEPIRVFSMKGRDDPSPRRGQHQAPQQVQLRSLAEVSRRRYRTPAGLGNLAPPRDARQARARRVRDYVAWTCIALAGGGGIALAIWLIAGR
jgi:hypothetical protein